MVMAHGVKHEWQEGTSPPPMSTQSSMKRAHPDVKRPANNKSEGNKPVSGSRRIFSPQFKLQVLDSYRNDSDCKGNQRATARKYGIHRRQIQKWLQMETHLRSVVEDSTFTSNTESTALNLSSARQRDVEESEPCRAGCLSSNKQAIPVLSDDRVSGSLLSSTPNSESRDDDSDVEIDVDGNSSSEEDFCDDDEDVYGNDPRSLGQNDRALDFTSAALSKRRFFPTEFKLSVLDAFYNDRTCTGNQRATARKFGINRRQIQKWLQQEPILRGECLDLTCKKRKLDTEYSSPPAAVPVPTIATPPLTATVVDRRSHQRLTPPSLPPPLHEIVASTTMTCCSMNLSYCRPPQWCSYLPPPTRTYEPLPPPPPTSCWSCPHPVYLSAVESPHPLESDYTKCSTIYNYQTLLQPATHNNEIAVYTFYR